MPKVIGRSKEKPNVQSVLIKKSHYLFDDAKKELIDMGFKNKGYEITDNFYRFRQYNPKKNEIYRTLKLRDNPGIELIIAVGNK